MIASSKKTMEETEPYLKNSPICMLISLCLSLPN